jgi:hypothetical protein
LHFKSVHERIEERRNHNIQERYYKTNNMRYARGDTILNDFKHNDYGKVQKYNKMGETRVKSSSPEISGAPQTNYQYSGVRKHNKYQMWKYRKYHYRKSICIAYG